MNRSTAKQLATKIEAALQPLAEELGMQIRARGGSFSGTAYMAKIEVAEVTGGVAMTPERTAFIEQAQFYGLKPGDLDAEIEHHGETFMIAGLSPRKRKYPIVMARQPDGKLYKFGDETVVRLLAASRSAAAVDMGVARKVKGQS